MRDKSLTLGTEPYHSHLQQIIASFHDHRGRVLIAAHRGDWRLAPENSLAAIQYSIVAGADLIEIDVQRTADGQLVLMHDETVDRMTNGSGRVAEMTLEQLRALRLRQHQGGHDQRLTNYMIPTLEEVMILARDKVMINLDKCWAWRDDVYAVLLRTDTVAQTVFKSTAEPEEVHSFLNHKPQKPLYMHILDDSNEHHVERIGECCEMVRPEAVEICFEQENSRLLQPSLLQRIQQYGCRLWVNTMWDSLCGGHSELHGAEGWEWQLQHGFNMIQTDNAGMLRRYLDEQ
ncbi:glycerophosphodiester phosphodiesterase family protein [Paenibacillus sp. WLX1005]|uniref:glycerophosphodiester phosphodiesterase family protein n=1 Tax=Paenibacillus sp. WLX1005 TaxID=3243766 RepID=UPI00398435C3